MSGLPSGWEVRHSNSKNLPYYFNPSTKESIWEPPTGTDREALKSYMALKLQSASTNSVPSSTNNNKTGSTSGAKDGKIRAAHLLVKHKDSRRPSSWRETKITRTKDEALAILRAHEDRIREGEARLGELARTESDDSSAKKGGDLGYFGRGMMQREFEEAAFKLKVGEVSGVVDTASGVHLIERLD